MPLAKLQDGSYLEHGVMKTVWTRFANKVCSSLELVCGPVVLLLQVPKPLLPCKSPLKPIYPAHEVVLRLVKDLLGLEDLEDPLPPVNDILCM